MGLLTRAFSAETTETPAKSGGYGGFLDFLGFGSSATLATGKSALTLSAFYNGVFILSSDIGMLPKAVFKKEDVQRIPQPHHPVNLLLSLQPSPLYTAFDFWAAIIYRQIVKGNAYAWIIRNERSGQVESLEIDDNITVRKKGNKLFYSKGGETVPGDDILHFKGFSLDGIMGIGVITFAAAQLGVQLEAQEYSGDVYKNRGLSYGVVESEKDISTDNKKLIQSGMQTALSGLSPHKVGVLDEGLKYKTISVTPAEAQFLETNKNGVIEVCRWLNLAPHKLKDLTNANYSNIYAQGTEHVQYTLMRWIVANEQECNRKLFPKNMLGVEYVKFNVNFLLRGDLDMKQKWYSAMIYAGVFSRNEVRAFEDMNPVDGLEAYLQPTNVDTLEMMMEKLKELKKDNNAGN